MKKVKFTPSAEAELKAIFAFVKKESPQAVKKLRDKIKAGLKRLEKYPESGRSIPEFPGFQGREVIVPPYRFFYQVTDDIVWILAVWHSSQLPTHP